MDVSTFTMVPAMLSWPLTFLFTICNKQDISIVKKGKERKQRKQLKAPCIWWQLYHVHCWGGLLIGQQPLDLNMKHSRTFPGDGRAFNWGPNIQIFKPSMKLTKKQKMRNLTTKTILQGDQPGSRGQSLHRRQRCEHVPQNQEDWQPGGN